MTNKVRQNILQGILKTHYVTFVGKSHFSQCLSQNETNSSGLLFGMTRAIEEAIDYYWSWL